jgi:uncharacterized protein YsxB (DUF464 family)
MDSILIFKWVNDVHCLLQKEKNLDFSFLLEIEKDNSFILEQLPEYDFQKMSQLYQFEAFAMEYKSLAKQYIKNIKPTLPAGWLGMQNPGMFSELEYAFLNLSAKKVFFDRIIRTFTEIWAAEKENWKPSRFCENTWMEMNNMKI